MGCHARREAALTEQGHCGLFFDKIGKLSRIQVQTQQNFLWAHYFNGVLHGYVPLRNL